MKKLSEFANTIISEQRGRPRKNKDVDLNDVDGKKADNFGGTKAEWGVNEKPNDDAVDDIDLDSEDNTESMQDLIDKFDAEEDFFIIGKAGWGKTTIIEKLAKKYGKEVVTVYLDKAVKEDLGGIPIPVQSKSGAVQEMALPSWAKVMQDNKDKEFLLFFDEMNQADPGVMNALMPIVLKKEIAGVKFDNFFVGAAGNFESENDAVSELSGPLKSRFKPLITWQTGDAKSWKAAFGYIHKEWDNKLGKKFVKAIEDKCSLFDNPREIEHKIFKFFYNIKNGGGIKRVNTEKIFRRLANLAKEDLTRMEETQLKQLAETINDILKEKSKDNDGEGGGRRQRKDINMIDPDLISAIKKAIKQGYHYDKESGIKYGVSRENISSIVDSNDINGEMLQRLINKFEDDGIEFKFEKNQQWKDAGYTDPDAD